MPEAVAHPNSLRAEYMGLLADIFVAPPADALEYESLVQNKAALIEKYQPAEYRNLTGLEFGSLWAILMKEQWDYEKHKLAEIRFGEGGETWLMEFPSGLVSLLSSLDESELPGVAAQWAKTEELELRGGDDIADLLADLRRLAIRSIESGERMVLWGSL